MKHQKFSFGFPDAVRKRNPYLRAAVCLAVLLLLVSLFAIPMGIANE
jgi:hypothetical protein